MQLSSSSAAPPEPIVDLILGEESRLRRLAQRLTRCESDADDLVQDTLLRAFRARARFLPGTSIRAWTGTILRRVFLTDAIRTRRRGVATDTDAGGALAIAGGDVASALLDGSAGRAAFFEHLDDDVRRSLDRVPTLYRVPFLLFVVDGLSCAEIAERLDIPPGTAMSRIHRARQRLRRDLADRAPAEAPALRVVFGVTVARARRATAVAG